mgnify:CR=1 FL=1
MQDDGRCLQGVVHDENARFLGGVAGNAGVFGNMDDLALFLQMLCNRGQLPDGTHYLCPATVELAMRNHTPGMAQGRGLSFYLPAYDNGYTGDLFPRETVGHTGFNRHQLCAGPHQRPVCDLPDQPHLPLARQPGDLPGEAAVAQCVYAAASR